MPSKLLSCKILKTKNCVPFEVQYYNSIIPESRESLDAHYLYYSHWIKIENETEIERFGMLGPRKYWSSQRENTESTVHIDTKLVLFPLQLQMSFSLKLNGSLFSLKV